MASSKELCCFCRLPKADLECEVCHDDVCKSCVVRLPEESFALMTPKPENLSKSAYCPRCHGDIVEPALATYGETLERAKQVGYWSRTYRGQVPVLKKGREKIEVSGGRDRDDVLIRLGYMATELGFNGLIQGELKSRKIRDHGYQKMEWSGHALPCIVDMEKVEREEWQEAHWRVLHHR